MVKWSRARVRWTPLESGGRTKPPTGPRYSTVAKFGDNLLPLKTSAWSVVLEFSETPDEFLCTDARIRFLSTDAPGYLLIPGQRFELVEGGRVVATVEIVDDHHGSISLNGAQIKPIVMNPV